MQTIRYLLAQHSQLAMFIAFFTFGMALYAPHIGNPFVLDDMTKIQWNPDLKESLPTLSTFLSPYHEIETPFRNDPSRPITFLAYWLCWQIGNGQSWPFHLLSIVIHILCAGLLSALVMRSSSPEAELGVRRAAAHAVGLLFLASPLLAGSVYYAFALSDLLAACFLLLALNNHMSNKKNHALEALLFGLALFSKQSSIVLPALYLILDWSQERLRKANYVLPVTMGVLYLIFRIWFFGAIGDLEAHGEVQARLPYLLSEGVMIWKYIGLFLMPQGLTIDHFITVGTHSWNLQISAWISLILIIGCCVFNKKLFQYTWGLLFFIVCLLPTSSAFPTVDLFVERRAYFATVGLYFLLATLFILAMKRAQFARRKLVWTLLLVTKIAINSSFTFARGQVYSSTESLWRESYLLIRKIPALDST